MANVTTDFSSGRKPTITSYDSEAFPLYFDYTIPAGFVLASGDTLELGPLPIGVQPIDYTVANNGVAATGAFSLGLLNAGKTDLDTTAPNGGAAWGTALAVTTGLARATTPAVALTVPSTTANRSVAIKATTPFGTPVTGGRLMVAIWCISA